MELMNFLKRLKRYRYILIFVPIATAVIAFFIARGMPNKYVSHARLASTVADKSQQLVSQSSQEESKIAAEFDNLLQTLTLNKVIDRVSYKLILNDLETQTPFRKPSASLEELTPEQRKSTIKLFKEFYNDRNSLDQMDPKQKDLYKLLKSMKYDYESLKKAIVASRMVNSQYINLEYASESPKLSAFVLNTLSEEFINYCTTVEHGNKGRALRYLDSTLQVKHQALLAQTEMLKEYKIENGILNVDDQVKNIYAAVAEMQAKKSTAEKDMAAYNAALGNIDKRFSPHNRKYFESSVSGINEEIVNIKDQIKTANDAYVQSGFDEKHKARIDSLQTKLTAKINAQTDNYATSPLTAKENLLTQKLSLEVSRDLAQNSVQSIDKELGKLQNNLQKLVPNLATIQAFQARIEVANKEYLDILAKFDQASLEANNNLPVRIIEKAMPGDASPNQKIAMVMLSGVVSFLLCVVVFFIMFYFDNTIESSEQLQDMIDIKVLGSLSRMNNSFLNLQNLWNFDATDKTGQEFKNSLRSIRYEMENHLDDDNSVIAVTSLDEGEGKTFITESLAYAFSKVNKKVLIIDGNFLNPEISNTINGPNYLESFLMQNGQTKMVDNDKITVIGNRGGDGSLLELTSAKNIKDFFMILKSIYDVIIVETSALNSANKASAKEWMSFADKVTVVFESGRKMDESAVRNVHYLKQLGGKLSGMIFNKVASETAPAGIKLLSRPKSEKAEYGYES
jgi:succinoglycan biosynthesis transport protein ExoP